MKRILVLGGSYFAGRVLVEELAAERAWEIHLFNRGRFPLNLPGVVEHRGDREDPAQLHNALAGTEWDAVVDFCAYTPEHIDLVLDSLPLKIGHYLLLSTTSVYQDTWDLPVREDAPKVLAPQPHLGPYARYGYDKLRAEQALERRCRDRGTPFTVLRPAIIYGFYNYAPRERYFFDLLLSNSPLVIPEGGLPLFSFIFVVDLARMILGVLANETTFDRAFNVASEELVSYPRLVELLKELGGAGSPVRYKTRDEIAREKIQLPFPLDAHLVYSGTLLARLLKFEFTPFASGLCQTYQYHLRARAATLSPEAKNG